MSHLSYNTIDYESLFSSHRPNEYMPFSDATYSTSDVCEWQESVALFENQDVRQHPINVQTPLVLLRSTCGGGDVGGGGVIATAVSRGDGGDGGEVRRVEESGVGDRIDPVVRSTFGVSPKSPPEKFSGGGDVVVAECWAEEDEPSLSAVGWWPGDGPGENPKKQTGKLSRLMQPVAGGGKGGRGEREFI
ncbi:hypothetical protein Tco_0296080 [Tanacetum coccineum]